MRNAGFVGTRWLGVGLASCLAVVTIALWLTGRLALYINPDSAWFAVGMAVLLLVGAVASFALPLGAEEDHGHDHGDGHAHAEDDDAPHPHPTARPVGAVALAGGLVASGVVVTMLVSPPASLSAELAMSRDVGAPPLFAGADVITLASSGDTGEFGVGEWASVFATATNPDTFDGDAISLTGFVTPSDNGSGFDLTRLVITHCVIDAQPATLPIASTAAVPDTGQWVTVTGTVRSTSSGALEITPDEVVAIDEPQDPYEY
ncbi:MULTISPECIES: TIGR03943 family putative permease subunit [unclassified Microbacterium]|uniref:TIGR03943 family putative permease subunit n=1 Tax=unclassified Microbacterium TaxID=2609290 RepID=UPI000D584054|nr:TIGR03943 family protein [Microbacterium sp. Gd 4-13]PVW05142.1 TIGR03943 family protein [Microbacterium sp. Gd 4-13]